MFTLVELLVVLAVLSVLMALLLPAVQQAREAARRTQCRNNLKQVALALHNYHGTFNIFPSGQYYCLPNTPCNATPFLSDGWAWTASLLPFVDQSPLFQGFDFSRALRDPRHAHLLATPLPVFECPSDATRKPLLPPTVKPFFQVGTRKRIAARPGRPGLITTSPSRSPSASCKSCS